MSLRTSLDRSFAIDRRSLAAFRVAIALILLVDLSIRAGSVVEHYGDHGIVPRARWIEINAGTARWSLHAMNGEPAFQRGLMALAAVAAGAMLVGWKTRWAVVFAWVLTHSIQMRNPMIVNGGDQLLRALLFWGMFLPLGSRWSLDAMLAGKESLALPDEPRLLSIPSACILLQFALMYVFTGLYKLNDVWSSGDALRRAFSYDLYVRPLGETLLAQESMLRAVSYAVPWLEIVLPVLCFVPVFASWFRGLAIILLGGMHVMIELTITTGLFSWVCLAGLLLLVPTRWWGSREGERREGEAPRGTEPRVLPGATQHGDASADARRRGQDPRLGGSLALPLLALFLYVLLWNLSGYQEHHDKARVLSARWAWLAELTGLDQKWEMFREPPVDTGWYVITGTLSSGSQVDLLTGAVIQHASAHEPAGPPSSERPKNVYAQIPDHRWRKYLASLSSDTLRGHRPRFANVWARRWNARHGPDEQVEGIEVAFIREKTVPPGETPTTQRVIFHTGPLLKEGEIIIGPDGRWSTGLD